MNIKLIKYKFLSCVTIGKNRIHYQNKYKKLKDKYNPYKCSQLLADEMRNNIRNSYIALSQGVDSKYFLENLFDAKLSLVRITLKDLKVSLFETKDYKTHSYPLQDSPAYKALQGERQFYDNYCIQKNPYGGGDIHNLQRFDDLVKSLEESNDYSF